MGMKTTVEIPDDLFRAVKARAALQNMRIKDLITQLLARWLTEGDLERKPETESKAERVQQMEAWLQDLRAVGQKIYERAVDPRSLVEILTEDRKR